MGNKWVMNYAVPGVTDLCGKCNTYRPGSAAAFASSSSHDLNKRPNTGKPNSTYKAPNGDKRTYDENGKQKKDYDHNDHGQPDKHPHDENGGHNHDWTNGVRGPAYVFDWEELGRHALGIGAGTLVLALLADNLVPGGVGDDHYIPQLWDYAIKQFSGG